MVTLIGSNEREDTLTLFLSIDGWDLTQVTFEWIGDWWEYKSSVKLLDFRMKREYGSAEEYIAELDKKCDEGVKQFAELLFENGKDRNVN